MQPNSSRRNPPDEMKSHLGHDEGVRAPPSTVCEIKRPSAPSPSRLPSPPGRGRTAAGLCVSVKRSITRSAANGSPSPQGRGLG